MLSMHKKRKGIVHASRTHLNTKLSELKYSLGGPDNHDIVKCLKSRLDALDTDLKKNPEKGYFFIVPFESKKFFILACLPQQHMVKRV